MKQEIIQGDCLHIMQQMESNSIDCILTDPPYGLSFMNKDWDKKLPSKDIWQEALRVCKPGAPMLCFGGTRTYHRLACVIEDSGWEIRDCIQWIYGSGFPKSHNHFGFDGYGTALKPAFEPVLLTMKPCEGTFAFNAEKWGVAGLNIDECRIGNEIRENPQAGFIRRGRTDEEIFSKSDKNKPEGCLLVKGRWPANVIFDEEAAELLDQMTGTLKSGSGNRRPNGGGKMFSGFAPIKADFESSSGGASRFFYCAKASSSERNAGLDCYITVKYTQDKTRGTLCHEENTVAEQLLQKVISDVPMENYNIVVSGENISVQFHKDFSSIIKTKIKQIIELKTLNLLMLLLTSECIQDVSLLKENGGNHAVNVENLKKWILDITKGQTELALGASRVALKMLSLISEEENWKRQTCTHPTVKPTKLLEYLLKLIFPPNPNAVVLDPFCGSGSTLVAASKLSFNAIGIEISPEYCDIAEKRVKQASNGRLAL